MTDLLYQLFTIWWQGAVAMFIVRGTYVSVDQYSYDGMLEIVFTALTWPLFIAAKIIERIKP